MCGALHAYAEVCFMAGIYHTRLRCLDKQKVTWPSLVIVRLCVANTSLTDLRATIMSLSACIKNFQVVYPMTSNR